LHPGTPAIKRHVFNLGMMFMGLGLIVKPAPNGHHDILGMVFGRLIDLNQGDSILVSSEVSDLTYRVAEKMLLPEWCQRLEVRLQNAQLIERSEDERSTLVLC
jgi:hypothetical protein